MANRPYSPPAVEVGDLVHWWYGAASDNPPAAAVVTCVGTRTLNLSIVEDGYPGFKTRSGVRHKADPDQLPEQAEEGCWDLTPRAKQLAELLAAFDPAKPRPVAKAG